MKLKKSQPDWNRLRSLNEDAEEHLAQILQKIISLAFAIEKRQVAKYTQQKWLFFNGFRKRLSQGKPLWEPTMFQKSLMFNFFARRPDAYIARIFLDTGPRFAKKKGLQIYSHIQSVCDELWKERRKLFDLPNIFYICVTHYCCYTISQYY